MTTQEIAERLVALCRRGNAETAQKELYASDAINIDPYGTAAFAKETKGRMSLNELCIYEVKDGKIISEQFTSRLHI